MGVRRWQDGVGRGDGAPRRLLPLAGAGARDRRRDRRRPDRDQLRRREEGRARDEGDRRRRAGGAGGCPGRRLHFGRSGFRSPKSAAPEVKTTTRTTASTTSTTATITLVTSAAFFT